MGVRRVFGSLAEAMGGFVLWIPGGIGSRLRRTYFVLRGAKIGRRVRIEVGVMIDQPAHVWIGNDCWIDRYAILIAGAPRPGRETRRVGTATEIPAGNIAIGDRCHIGPSTVLSGLGGLSIGNDVTLAAGTKVYSLTHHYRSWSNPADSTIAFGSMVPAERQSMLEGPVQLAENVGVGVDCLILPGVSIGSRSFVRPHSVVASSFHANSLIAGNPAQREGDRFSENSG